MWTFIDEADDPSIIKPGEVVVAGSPTRSHHGTAEHIAAFSPGWTRHVHFEHGRRA